MLSSLIQAATAVRQGVGGAAPTTPAIGRPVVEQVNDVGTLRSHLNELRVELTGLQAQWEGLYSQLNVMLKTNPARPGVQQQWADVGVRIAQVKGQIALREAQIAQAEGRPIGTTTTAPGPPPFSVNPDVAFPVAAGLLIVLGLPVSIAWARRILRGKPQPAPLPPPDFSPRLENIERAIDAIAIEVERISEGQRFVTKILTERDRASAEASAAASSAPPQPKALGAGPIEPINVAQRERVRERIITPH
jgi:hypothetical protein